MTHLIYDEHEIRIVVDDSDKRQLTDETEIRFIVDETEKRVFE